MSFDCLYIFSRLFTLPTLIYTHTTYTHLHVYMKYVRSSQRSMKCRWKKCVLYWEKRRGGGWMGEKWGKFCAAFRSTSLANPLWKTQPNILYVDVVVDYIPSPSPSLTLSLPFVHPHVKFSIFSRFLYFIIICFPPFPPFSTGCSLCMIVWVGEMFSAPHFWVVLVYPQTTRVGNKINLHSTPLWWNNVASFHGGKKDLFAGALMQESMKFSLKFIDRLGFVHQFCKIETQISSSRVHEIFSIEFNVQGTEEQVWVLIRFQQGISNWFLDWITFSPLFYIF